MNKTRTRWIVAAVLGLVTSSTRVHAQDATGHKYRKNAVASGVVMVPQGDFRHALQTIGLVGGAFHYDVPIRSSPISIGFDYQALFYQVPTGRRNTEQIGTIQGLVRACRCENRRRPYVEAVAGIKGFSVDINHVASSYGVGGGVQFFLRPETFLDKPAQEVWEIGVRYQRGGSGPVDYNDRVAASSHSVMFYVGWGYRF